MSGGPDRGTSSDQLYNPAPPGPPLQRRAAVSRAALQSRLVGGAEAPPYIPEILEHEAEADLQLALLVAGRGRAAGRRWSAAGRPARRSPATTGTAAFDTADHWTVLNRFFTSAITSALRRAAEPELPRQPQVDVVARRQVDRVARHARPAGRCRCRRCSARRVAAQVDRHAAGELHRQAEMVSLTIAPAIAVAAVDRAAAPRCCR